VGAAGTGIIAENMRPRRVAALALPLAVLAASQAGHLLAWQLRHGPAALTALRAGVHGYVPAITTIAFGLAGTAVLAALWMVALARILRFETVHGRGPRRLRRTPALDMAAFFFTLQLAIYVVQETAEAAWVGYPRPSFADVLLWGSVGQLPIALVAGVALSWLSVRLEVAVAELRTGIRALPLSSLPALPVVRLWAPPDRVMLPIEVLGGAFTVRGPPRTMRPGPRGR
jgi:hypothetical protein